MLSPHVSFLYFLVFLSILRSTLATPKNTKSIQPSNLEFVPLPEPLSKRVLSWVASHQHHTYETNMFSRASHYSSARRITNSFPPRPSPPSEDLVQMRAQHLRAGAAAYKKAEGAAKTNRAIASVMKGVKTTHKPRVNDFRRWGYEPADSELSRKTPESGWSRGSSWMGTRQPLELSFRSSRTASPASGSGKEEEQSVHGGKSMEAGDSHASEGSKSPAAGQKGCFLQLGRWVCQLPGRAGRRRKREREREKVGMAVSGGRTDKGIGEGNKQNLANK